MKSKFSKTRLGAIRESLAETPWAEADWLCSPWWISPVVAVALALLLTASGCARPEPPHAPVQQPITGGHSEEGAPGRNPDLENATALFGPAVVWEGDFDAQSKRKPWSGYWYPIRKREIFSGTLLAPSPLEKYDQYVLNAHHENAGAAAYERDSIYPSYGGDAADGWAGLCNAWAMASLLEPEPAQPVTVGGVSFSVGDQKALITKMYEYVEGIRIIGQRYDGDRNSVYDDVYPDQFHRALQVVLFDHHDPFVMDVDPSVAVWNFPVYQAFLKIRRDSQDDHRMHVEAWITAAKALTDQELDSVGTLPNHYDYTYDLVGDPRPDGGIDVRWGEWTGRSRDVHPDFLTLLPDANGTVIHGSNNIKIRNDRVREILRGR